MSSVRRRRMAAASLATTALLALTACGTGFSAQTNQVYQPGTGANARGDVDSLNTLLVANTDGSATVSATLHNNLTTSDSLSSVTVTTLDGQSVDVRSPKILLPLPAGQLVDLGTTDDAGVFTVAESPASGTYVKVTFTFSKSEPLTVQAPIVARTAEYSDVAGGDGLVPSDVSGADDQDD